jgi:hypothetical protein
VHPSLFGLARGPRGQPQQCDEHTQSTPSSRRVGSTIVSKHTMVSVEMGAVLEGRREMFKLSACHPFAHPCLPTVRLRTLLFIKLISAGLDPSATTLPFAGPISCRPDLTTVVLFWLRTLYNLLPCHYDPDVPDIRPC